MGRGASPLRTMARNSPKKPPQENMEGVSLSSGELTPTRKPLSSISEVGRANNFAVSDENCADAVTPNKGKLESTTPKAKKKGGQCLFPHTENEGISGTPDKHGNVKSKKSHSRHQSPMKNQTVARSLQDTTPAESGPELLLAPSSEIPQLAAGAGFKGLSEQPGAGRLGTEIGHGQTPRVHRNERGKLGNDAEAVSSSRPHSNLQPSSTPSKSVTRTLKYGASSGTVGTGFVTSRAMVPLGSSGRIGQPGTSEQHFELEEDHEFWHDHNVQVLIRTRPISSTEMASQGFSKCLKQESPHTITWLGPPDSRFTFDHVAGEIVTQEKLFKVAGLPMVENCMAGYNSCMFAYGQTGSGKTHTMLGDIDHLGDKPSENRGMTPRVFEYLFSRIQLEEEQRRDENLRFLTKCSFLEIYNEQITDLLEPTSTNLQMREDARKGVYVENLTEVEVNSVQDVIQLLLQGSANRKVAATNMNRESSRSHSVFTCIIESKWESDSMTNIRFGRLNLVDLAGSERQKTSGAEGERLKEAANINKSLSTLGLVIMILVDVANGKQRHVPYRDSKLTFLLQDSLGGNSKTTIIATVSPSSCNALETLSTLKFAQRAKLIRNTAVVNEDASGDVKALRAQIQQMKEELDRLRRQSISRIPLTHDDFNPVRSSFDSWGDANKFFGSPQVSNRKIRQMEAVLAGALRREQASDVTTKRLVAEIEQLNRLVHQREADTQSSKMILRFREDKIRRLETLSKGVLSVDSYRAEEQKVLMEELTLLREKLDRNPELTRFAMENIRLLDQLRSLQEYHEGGERDVMLEEISNLRDQLLEVLDGKIAVDQGLVPLTTPQKKALAPELAAASRETELLRIETDNYRCEVEELRSNLSSSLESYSKMGRQVDELQEVIEQLKVELAAKQDSPELLNMKTLEQEQARHLELIADLRLQLEQNEAKSRIQESRSEQLDHQLKEALEEAGNLQMELEATKEAFEAARSLTKKLQSKEAHLVAAQYTAAVKQIRLETEEMAVQQSQSLTNIQEMAVLWRMKETELRAQLDEAHSTIEKLSEKTQMQDSCAVPARSIPGIALNSVRAEDGSFERLQRAQEIEMRHAEEVMQLNMELESLEAVLEEERAQRKDLDEKLAHLEIMNERPSDTNHVDCSQKGGDAAREIQLQLKIELETIQVTLSEERALRQDLEEKAGKLMQQLQEAQDISSRLKEEEVRETTYFDAVSKMQFYSPDQKALCLSQQLDQEKALVEALESQHLFSIREFEALQAENIKVLDKLKRREEKEKILRKKIDRLEYELVKEQELRELEQEYADLEEGGEMDDFERLALEKKLEAAKREVEIAHAENQKLKEEEMEKDMTRCQAETETVLAITCMQSELVDLKDEAEIVNKELTAAREKVLQLSNELDNLRTLLTDIRHESSQMVDKYEVMLKDKDSEIQVLRKDWESATVRLIDYLAEGDQALNEASFEMEQIFNDYLPSSTRSSREGSIVSRTTEKKKAVEQLKQQLQHAQDLAKDTEGRVRVLSEAAFAMATAQAHETPQKVHHLSLQATGAMEVLQNEVDLAKKRLWESEENSLVMSVLTRWLLDTVEEKKVAGSNMRMELTEKEIGIQEKERLILTLQSDQETYQALHRESKENLRQLTNNLEEAKKEMMERDTHVTELGREVVRLQLSMEVLETEKRQLCDDNEKAEQRCSECSLAMRDLEVELAQAQSQLREAVHKEAEAVRAQESLTVLKEELEIQKTASQNELWELQEAKAKLDLVMSNLEEELVKAHAQSEVLLVAKQELELEKSASHHDLSRLKEERISLDVELIVLKEKLAAVDARSESLKSQLTEKEAEISTLKDDNKRMSCMSIEKEEDKHVELQRELEAVRAELQHKQTCLTQSEIEMLGIMKSSEAHMKEVNEKVASLEHERDTMSSMIVEKEQEFAEVKKEFETLQMELQIKQNLLLQAEAKSLQALEASEQLIREKDEQIAVLKEEAETMSFFSIKKEQELVESAKELEALQRGLQTKEALLQQAETKSLEALDASEQLIREKDEKIATLKEEAETLSSFSSMKEQELVESGKEIETLRKELQTNQTLLEQTQDKLLQALEASEQLIREKDEHITSLKENSEVLSYTSVKKEKELLESRNEQENLHSQLLTTQALLQQAEYKIIEASVVSDQLIRERDGKIPVLKEENKRMTCMSVEKEHEELAGLTRELGTLRGELQIKETILQEGHEQVSVLKGENKILTYRHNESVELLAESQALQEELISKDTLLREAESRVTLANAVSEKLSAEKKVLEKEIRNLTLAVDEAAARLLEAVGEQSSLQVKVACIEAQFLELKNKEKILIMEIEELTSSKNMNCEDVDQLERDIAGLRDERDRLALEVSTMDMQGAISEKLQLIRTLCMNTDDRITSMQTEIDELTIAKETLETEVQLIEAKAEHLLLELADKKLSVEVARQDLEQVQVGFMETTEPDNRTQLDGDLGTSEELIAAQAKLQAAEEQIEIMAQTIGALNEAKTEKEEEYVSLQDRLVRAKANRKEAQDKLDAFTVVMHEFSVAEEGWRNEKANILSDIESIKAHLAEKEAECLAAQEDKGVLEVRLHEVLSKEVASEAKLAALESHLEEAKSIGKNSEKDISSNKSQVELAKARAALAGAEERVKLLVNANANMIDDWEGERSRLNAERELLQMEISRLEKPVLTVLDENECVPVDSGNSKDHFVDELKHEIRQTRADCENIRSKLRERDNTILSVRMQLEEAVSSYKEREIEVENIIREKEDAMKLIAAFKDDFMVAQNEIMRREGQVDAFEAKFENVMMRVTESEALWRSEKDQLESEREEALVEAYEVACELADLKRRFEDSQVTIGGDDKSSSKKNSTPDLEESVNLSLESIAAITSAKEEVDLTKDHCEKEMETLAVDMQSLRADISNSFFEFPVVEIQQDVKSIIEAHRAEIATMTGKIQSFECLLAESNSKVSTLQATLEDAQEGLQSLLAERESREMGVYQSSESLEAAEKSIDIQREENSRKELEMSEAAVSELLAAVSERDCSISNLEKELVQARESLARTEMDLKAAQLELNETEQLRGLVQSLQRQVGQKEELIKGLEYDINLLEDTGSTETEQKQEIITQLQKELDGKSEELQQLTIMAANLETQLKEEHQTLFSIKEELLASTANTAQKAEERNNLQAKLIDLEAQFASLEASVEERDSVVTSLKAELLTAETLVKENEAVAANARESAEVFKNRAQEVVSREEEMKSRYFALENQVKIMERKEEEHLQMQQDVEKELKKLRHRESTSQASQLREAQAAKLSLERRLTEVEGELSLVYQKLQILQSKCDTKDAQIHGSKAQISQLTRTSSLGHQMDYSNADFAAKSRIQILEELAATRQKEVYALNARLAEYESEMHDLVREIVGNKLEVQMYKDMVTTTTQPQVNELVATVRRQSLENQEKGRLQEQEVDKLRRQLNELIEERDSWLEEMQRRQAEMVAARITAEKMRIRDESLSAENDKLKTDCAGRQKKITELEQEIKKLSGQQNLQQRIHHHAKIKDENNTLRLQVEDLGAKIRRNEMMFARVKDELERYRLAAGKTSFPNIDEEQRLKSKLQEAEESKIQIAQKFITLSNAIFQAAGIANPTRQVDQSAALEALRKLEIRLRSTEDELSEVRLKTRIEGEKRRLSDLRAVHTPVKSISMAASQNFYRSPAMLR